MDLSRTTDPISSDNDHLLILMNAHIHLES